MRWRRICSGCYRPGWWLTRRNGGFWHLVCWVRHQRLVSRALDPSIPKE